jgi:hypothetical protein
MECKSQMQERDMDALFTRIATDIDRSVTDFVAREEWLECRRQEAQRQLEMQRKEIEQMELDYSLRVAAEWCQNNGYTDVNTPKRTFMGLKFPLHTAVKQGNIEMICLLLRCGASTEVKDHKGRRPKDLVANMSGLFPEQTMQLLG